MVKAGILLARHHRGRRRAGWPRAAGVGTGTGWSPSPARQEKKLPFACWGVDESWSAVYLGYTHGSSLSVDGAQTTNSMVTQDSDKLFIQVRPPSCRNTYVLRLVVLICVERIVCPRGVPCLSLYSLKGRVTGKLSYLVQYLVVLRCTPTSRAPHVFILWAEPPLTVRPI